MLGDVALWPFVILLLTGTCLALLSRVPTLVRTSFCRL